MVWNFRSLKFSFPGTFAPGSETSKNFRSLELSLPGGFLLCVPIYARLRIFIQLDGQGQARRKAARRRNSECKNQFKLLKFLSWQWQ